MAGLIGSNARTARYCSTPVDLVDNEVRQMESETAHSAPALTTQMALPAQLKCS